MVWMCAIGNMNSRCHGGPGIAMAQVAQVAWQAGSCSEWVDLLARSTGELGDLSTWDSRPGRSASRRHVVGEGAGGAFSWRLAPGEGRGGPGRRTGVAFGGAWPGVVGGLWGLVGLVWWWWLGVLCVRDVLPIHPKLRIRSTLPGMKDEREDERRRQGRGGATGSLTVRYLSS
jgi:hypothetical protein